MKHILSKISLFFVAYMLTPFYVYGSEYVTLSKTFPVKITTDSSTSLPTFLNALLVISVGVSAILAVIMLTIGGFKYMTSESVFKIGGAKEQIANAVIGLLIVLTAILILTIINPEIVKLNLFKI